MSVPSLRRIVHLKAAAVDILLESLISSGRYIQDLLAAYWAAADERQIIEDVEAFFPSECVWQFQAFCARNYPPLLEWFHS